MARRRFDPHRIFDEPLTMPIAEVVRELITVLERPPVALLGDVKSAREVSAWAAGTTPRPERVHTLRSALQAARLIVDLEGVDSARAWFMGTNFHFDFRAPAQILRDGGDEARAQVVRAAKDFVKEALANAERVELVHAYL
jgi:hypothetical protein